MITVLWAFIAAILAIGMTAGAFAAGFFVARRLSKPKAAEWTREQKLAAERQRRELYNFWTYDGADVPYRNDTSQGGQI